MSSCPSTADELKEAGVAEMTAKQLLRKVWRIATVPVFSPRSYWSVEDVQKWRRGSEPADGAAVTVDLPAGKPPWPRRILFGLGMRLLALPLVVIPALMVLLYATTHPRRVTPAVSPDVLGMYFEDVSFATSDGITLRGWYIPALHADDVLQMREKVLTHRRPVVILCHALGGCRDQLLPLARSLNGAGYDVLCFDFRGCGASGGDSVGFGYLEQLDVQAALRFVRGRPGVDTSRIGIIGVNTGAVAAVRAAAADGHVRAVVADGVYPDLPTAIERTIEAAGLPAGWLSRLYKWGLEFYTSIDAEQVSAVAAVRDLKDTALLVIAGSRDRRVRPGDAVQVYQAAGPSRKWYLVDGAGFGESYLTDPVEYELRVLAFLRDSFGEDVAQGAACGSGTR